MRIARMTRLSTGRRRDPARQRKEMIVTSTFERDLARTLEQLAPGLAPAIAKWLAPYLAAEIGGAPGPTTARQHLTPDYDETTCEEYVREIGTPVLERAEDFVANLAQPDGVNSLAVARLLEVDSPRQIAALLTNSLKRRAKALGLPYPWQELEVDGRTVWRDRDGIASRLYPAILDELERRLPHPADTTGGPRSVEDRQRLAEPEPDTNDHDDVPERS